MWRWVSILREQSELRVLNSPHCKVRRVLPALQVILANDLSNLWTIFVTHKRNLCPPFSACLRHP